MICLLKKRGYHNIRLLNLVGAPEGVKKVQAEHPDVDIYLASLDEKLNIMLEISFFWVYNTAII